MHKARAAGGLLGITIAALLALASVAFACSMLEGTLTVCKTGTTDCITDGTPATGVMTANQGQTLTITYDGPRANYDSYRAVIAPETDSLPCWPTHGSAVRNYGTIGAPTVANGSGDVQWTNVAIPSAINGDPRVVVGPAQVCVVSHANPATGTDGQYYNSAWGPSSHLDYCNGFSAQTRTIDCDRWNGPDADPDTEDAGNTKLARRGQVAATLVVL